jgi:hypothetical protein
MMQTAKTSVARRVWFAFRATSDFKDNRPIWEGWATVFEIAPDSSGQAAIRVAHQLSLLNLQLEVLEGRLLAEVRKLEPEKVRSAIARLQTFIAACVSGLTGTWHGVKGVLTENLLAQLDVWQQLLDEDEVALDHDDLRSLRDELYAFEARLRDTADPQLRSLLQDIVDALKRSIEDYAIGGERAMRGGIRDAFSIIQSNRSTLDSNAEEVSNLASIWRKFVGICEPIIVADALFSAYQHGGPIAAQMLKMIGME